MNRVLLTGFEPFGGSEANPSGDAARQLDGARLAGALVVGRVLPVSWQLALPRLLELLAEVRPAALLMSGQAGRPHLAPEAVGINLRNGRDNDGVEACDQPVVPGGPAAYFSTFDARGLAEALGCAGLPARVSYSAGTYLCNCVLYGGLHHLAAAARPVPAGFIHVPLLPGQAALAPGQVPPPSMAAGEITAGLELALRQLAGRLD